MHNTAIFIQLRAILFSMKNKCCLYFVGIFSMCGSFWEPLKGKISLMCGEKNSKFPKIVTFEKKMRESRKEKGIHQFRKVEIHAGLLKKKKTRTANELIQFSLTVVVKMIYFVKFSENDFRWVFITRFFMQQGLSTVLG